MLLHVSVCDHHQGARNWAQLKLQLLKMFGKNRSLWTCSGVGAYYVKSIVQCTQHIHHCGIMETKTLTCIEGSVLQLYNTYQQHPHTVKAFTANTKEVRLKSGGGSTKEQLVIKSGGSTRIRQTGGLVNILETPVSRIQPNVREGDVREEVGAPWFV